MKGTPEELPIPGLIVEVVMKRLKASISPVIKPKMWIRHVGDIIVTIKTDQLKIIYNLINVFDDIKFTMEK